MGLEEVRRFIWSNSCVLQKVRTTKHFGVQLYSVAKAVVRALGISRGSFRTLVIVLLFFFYNERA